MVQIVKRLKPIDDIIKNSGVVKDKWDKTTLKKMVSE